MPSACEIAGAVSTGHAHTIRSGDSVSSGHDDAVGAGHHDAVRFVGQIAVGASHDDAVSAGHDDAIGAGHHDAVGRTNRDAAIAGDRASKQDQQNRNDLLAEFWIELKTGSYLANYHLSRVYRRSLANRDLARCAAAQDFSNRGFAGIRRSDRQHRLPSPGRATTKF